MLFIFRLNTKRQLCFHVKLCAVQKNKKKPLAVVLHFKITLSLLVIPLSGESALRSHDAAPQYNLFIELSSDHL